MGLPRWIEKDLRDAIERDPIDQLSERVIAMQYEHVEDGELYSHDFDNGVDAITLGDQYVVLFRRDGKPISREFGL